MAKASVKTPWRNAACLMFMSGPFMYNKPPQQVTNPPSIFRIPFIQYKTKEKSECEILFVQRHSKSSFMANTHVFPGGVLDKADYSPGWLHLFTELQGCEHPFSSVMTPRTPPLPIYGTIPPESPIAAEVAFRICAIREFFEEAGILLARNSDDVSSKMGMVPGSFGPAIKRLSHTQMEVWRGKVHDDPYQFITMCRELNCVPDIWSLIEWSDWLTPHNYKRRYDTLFFMCFSGERPQATPDIKEVTSGKWMAPSVASELLAAGKVMLAPPQFSEIRKLEWFSDVSLLHLFGLNRSLQENGIYCKKSVRILTKDSVVLSVSNIDDLYPLEGSEDWTTPLQHPQSLHLQRHGVSLVLSHNTAYEYTIPTHTAQELRELSTNTNRMELNSLSDFNFIDSVDSNLILSFLKEKSSNL